MKNYFTHLLLALLLLAGSSGCASLNVGSRGAPELAPLPEPEITLQQNAKEKLLAMIGRHKRLVSEGKPAAELDRSMKDTIGLLEFQMRQCQGDESCEDSVWWLYGDLFYSDRARFALWFTPAFQSGNIFATAESYVAIGHDWIVMQVGNQRFPHHFAVRNEIGTDPRLEDFWRLLYALDPRNQTAPDEEQPREKSAIDLSSIAV